LKLNFPNVAFPSLYISINNFAKPKESSNNNK
jgi:hypothetical protein